MNRFAASLYTAANDGAAAPNPPSRSSIEKFVPAAPEKVKPSLKLNVSFVRLPATVIPGGDGFAWRRSTSADPGAVESLHAAIRSAAAESETSLFIRRLLL